jgi:hypothetical protein
LVVLFYEALQFQQDPPYTIPSTYHHTIPSTPYHTPLTIHQLQQDPPSLYILTVRYAMDI